MRERRFRKEKAALKKAVNSAQLLSLILDPGGLGLEIKERLKKAKALLEQLEDGWIFVEGKRDKEALAKLGLHKVLTVSGNLRLSCKRVKEKGDEKVFVLTDLDRRGDQLAKMAKDELEGLSITAELTTRKILAYMLNIRYFEDAKRAYDELIEEGEKNG